MRSTSMWSAWLVVVFTLWLACSCLAQSHAESQTVLTRTPYIPDIATFLQIGGSTPVGYSWDGKDAFFTSSMSGANQVYRLTETGWPYQLSTFPDGIDFFTLSWGGYMAVLGASVGGSELSQLYLMDTKTGRTFPLSNEPKVQ
ncbi:MAG TPA: hypothetical protein VMS71_01550, partial [Candidatus Acidoferrum sp.]|nr:hypothetical protein [Candidatus Acidoferrum sp.]